MFTQLIQIVFNYLRDLITRIFTWIRHGHMITDNNQQSPIPSPTRILHTPPYYYNQISFNSNTPIQYTSIGSNTCEYRHECYQFEDDGWNSDPDTNDPTLFNSNTLTTSYLTSNEYINSMSHLSEYELLNDLYSYFFSQKQATIDDIGNILNHLLVRQQDPYSFSIRVVNLMKKLKLGRCSPSKLCLTVLENFLQENTFPVLTLTHQIQALEVGVLCPPSILDELCRIYHCDSLSDEIKCRVMKELITSNQYKEASVAITRFGLQAFFSVEEILPPLIGTDQINLIQAYIGSDTDLQIQFIMLLDKLCSPHTDYLRLYSYYQSSGFAKGSIANNKLCEHQIKRLAGRLINTYELDASLFVHFTTAKVSSFTASLLHQYYVLKGNDKQIHAKNWIDLLTASVAQSEELQINLVEELVLYNDYKIAVYIVNYFNLSQKIPESISDLLSNTRPYDPSNYRNSISGFKNTKFYPLNINFDNIILIDTPAKLQKCQENISNKGTVIGIDAEWLMPNCNFGILRLAILQLATRDFIFLLDMVVLTGAVSQSQQVSFIQTLFHSSDTIKLGFAIEGDLKMLGRTWPCVAKLLNDPTSTIDLQTVADSIKSRSDGLTNTPSNSDISPQVCEARNAEAMSIQSLSKKTSLTKLIEECFGLPMDKSNQIANWEKRPIRDDMKIYAALDAFCLIELFDYFKDKFGDTIF
ncbi:exonuclease mut-7-like-like [Oopsacas minuta]|uniref:Exonuclease mut-7-like-like n=1 Tax=Oopsacas minuta TaxID=111878 RepID=A0AAV7JUY0_9METZ|nr:exonuclease mut-7-like-like [Oopsacas minuta]